MARIGQRAHLWPVVRTGQETALSQPDAGTQVTEYLSPKDIQIHDGLPSYLSITVVTLCNNMTNDTLSLCSNHDFKHMKTTHYFETLCKLA